MASSFLESRDEGVIELTQMVQHLQHQNSLLRDQSSLEISELDDNSTSSCISGSSSRTIRPPGSEKNLCDSLSEHFPQTSISKLDKKQLNGMKKYKSSPKSSKDEALFPEEECWLYKPTKNPENSMPTGVHCMQWAREIFDSPSSKLHAHRNHLLNRLSMILFMSQSQNAPMKFGGSVPSLTVLPFSSVEENKISASHSSNATPGALKKTYSVYSMNNDQTSMQNKGILNATNDLQFRIRESSPSIFASSNRNQSSVEHLASASGSFDDLKNVSDLQTIARIQKDTLKAQVAALNAAAASRSDNRQSPDSSKRSSLYDPDINQLDINENHSPLSITPKFSQYSSTLPFSYANNFSSFGSTNSMDNINNSVISETNSIASGFPRTFTSSPSPPSLLPRRLSPDSNRYISLFNSKLEQEKSNILSNDIFSHQPKAVIVGRSQNLYHNRSAIPTKLAKSSKLATFVSPRRPNLEINNYTFSRNINERVSPMLPSYVSRNLGSNPSQNFND